MFQATGCTAPRLAPVVAPRTPLQDINLLCTVEWNFRTSLLYIEDMDNEMSSNLPPAPTSGVLETGPAVARSQPNVISDLIPCTATASMLLYAQGSSVICTKYTTLHIERRFLRHTENIILLAADTASTAGVGVVVSCDEGHTAIVWNYHSGDEIARFTSYDRLTAVAWMRDGNIIFGR